MIYQLSNLSTITTNRTYFIKVADVFVISYNALVSVGSFLGLTITALAPFAVVGAVIYFPSRVLYVKQIKPRLKVKEVKENKEDIE